MTLISTELSTWGLLTLRATPYWFSAIRHCALVSERGQKEQKRHHALDTVGRLPAPSTHKWWFLLMDITLPHHRIVLCAFCGDPTMVSCVLLGHCWLLFCVPKALNEDPCGRHRFLAFFVLLPEDLGLFSIYTNAWDTLIVFFCSHSGICMW